MRTTILRYGMAAALLAAVSVVAAAQGKPDFEFRRDLAAGRRFHLSDIMGNVRVTGGPGRALEVTATMREGRYGDKADVRIETIELDDGVALCVRYPSQGHGHRSSDRELAKNPCSWSGDWNNDRHERNDTEVDFVVRVPAGLKLHIGTVSGDVEAEGLEGEIDLASVSGNVRLEGGKGSQIDLETVSGDVHLLDISSKEVSGRTVSGTIAFRGAMQDAGSYDFSTTSGDISVALPERPNATLSAATFSGRMSSDLPTGQDDGSRRHRHRYDATWGSGSAKLYMESLSGDLVIRVGK